MPYLASIATKTVAPHALTSQAQDTQIVDKSQSDQEVLPVNGDIQIGDAFFLHGLAAYQAARHLGKTNKESLKLALRVASLDFITPSGKDPSAHVQNLHGTGGLINGLPQTVEERRTGIIKLLNQPAPVLQTFGIPADDITVLASRLHGATDLANKGHRMGWFEGLNNASWLKFSHSLGSMLHHFVVIDVIHPLGNWKLRVENAMTAMTAHTNGDPLSYEEHTGKVFAKAGTTNYSETIPKVTERVSKSRFFKVLGRAVGGLFVAKTVADITHQSKQQTPSSSI